MIAKEKATELYQKYLPQCIGYNGFFDKTNVNSDTNGKAKLCALICVDEILNEIPCRVAGEESEQFIFWIEVKEEIKKL